MSRSLNRASLIGHVGQDPECRTTAGGTKMAKISLATSRKWKDKSGRESEKTEWHRVTFWDRMAEIVEQYVHKGDRLFVEGRLEYSQSEHEGVTRYFTDIIAQEMILLGGGAGEREAAPARTGRSAPAPNPFDSDGPDGLPF